MNSPRHAGLHSPRWSVFPRLVQPEEGATVLSNRAKLAPVPERKPVKQPAPRANSHVRAVALNFSNMSQYGDLLVRYMQARKSVFIDSLGWDLPHTDGMEFDQYDTPQCYWIAIHAFGEVVGGFRLMPTTSRCGVYTYMLADAQKGMLSSIPQDVLFLDAPQDDTVWEASRLFVVPNVPAEMRHDVQAALMEKMMSVPRDNGARSVIGMVPNVFSRWLRRLGLGAVPVGPKFTIDGVRSQAALFNVMQTLH